MAFFQGENILLLIILLLGGFAVGWISKELQKNKEIALLKKNWKINFESLFHEVSSLRMELKNKTDEFESTKNELTHKLLKKSMVINDLQTQMMELQKMTPIHKTAEKSKIY